MREELQAAKDYQLQLKAVRLEEERKMEEEFLPVAKRAAKYDRSLGYLPAGIELPGD